MLYWIRDLYNYYFTDEREQFIRSCLEKGDYNKELVDRIVNLKKPVKKTE